MPDIELTQESIKTPEGKALFMYLLQNKFHSYETSVLNFANMCAHFFEAHEDALLKMLAKENDQCMQSDWPELQVRLQLMKQKQEGLMK